MRVHQWSQLANIADEKYGSFSGVSPSLLECSRSIFIFIDGNEYKMTGRVERGKMLLVNMSASTLTRDTIGAPIGISYMSTSNSVLTSMNIYNFDLFFAGNVNDLDSTICELKSGIGDCSIEDFSDDKCYKMEMPLYKSDYRNSEAIYMMNMPGSVTPLPKPNFYTVQHQYDVEGDFYTICDVGEVFVFPLRELYDDKSRIYVYDRSAYITLVPQLYMQLKEVKNNKESKNVDPSEISEQLLYNKMASMISGIGVIYDSQGGSNILSTPSTQVGLGRFRVKNSVSAQLDYMRQQIEYIASSIEKTHGSIRIHYSPFLSGDKIQVIFKDYRPDNQPIGTTSEMGVRFNNGVSVDGMTISDNEITESFNDSAYNDTYDPSYM